jgi:hypothetical protein
MRCLMLVCRDESIPFTTDDLGPEVQAWASEMEERGIRLQGAVFAPVNATATVSVRGGETHVDRGPRVEMAVPASGFNLLECADVDEAIEVSAKHPIAGFGVIELRPLAAW